MRQKAVMIAIAGENMDGLYVAIRDFPTERVILLTPKEHARQAESVKRDLGRFHIPAHIVPLVGNVWEDIFRKIAEICANEGQDREIIVNAGTGDRNAGCAATSAAFVNGLKAVSVDQNGAMLLPVLKFNYYRLLSDRKLALLRILNQHPNGLGMEELSRKARMSLPLTSYHANGNLKSEGLLDLGLVETEERDGRVNVQLSTLGKLLIKGYVK